MANGVTYLNSGTTTEVGCGRFLKKFSLDCDGVFANGDFLVSERAAGANKSVDIAAGDVAITTIAGTAAYHGFETTAPTNKAIGDNASGNPRIDAVSVYVDVAAYAAGDNSGALKFKVTAGTAAASPTAPSTSDIQADVGAANPFLRLADVYVPNGFTQVNNAYAAGEAYIFDRRTFAQSQDDVRRDYDTQPERVITGLQPATDAGLSSNVSVGECYVRGRYVAKGRAEYHTYTASKDTYVDIDNTGTFTFTAVNNGAAEPAVASNSIRLAKAVTDADNITSVTDLRNLYAYGIKWNSADLNLTNAAQVVPNLTATFEVSTASTIFIESSLDVDMTSGTAACNLNDVISSCLYLDTVQQAPVSAQKCVVNNNGRDPLPYSWAYNIAAGAHTITIEALNNNGNRGLVEGSVVRSYMRWTIRPGYSTGTA